MRLYETKDLPASARAAEIAGRCANAHQTRHGWLACCPSHPDRNPSLSITPADDKILLKCFAGCQVADVLAAIGLTLADLFTSSRPLSAFHGTRARPVSRRPPDAANRRTRLLRIWRQARAVTADDPVSRYLRARGIWQEPVPVTLRYHAHLPYWHDEDHTVTFHPALVAAVQDPTGMAVTLHRVYLATNGEKAGVPHPKKSLPPTTTMRGAGVRLDDPTDTLAITEGVETGLAIRLTAQLPVWAALSAGGMTTIVVPDIVSLVLICADNDASGTGEQAAKKLARRLLAEGRRVKILLPGTVGMDWADSLRQEASYASR